MIALDWMIMLYNLPHMDLTAAAFYKLYKSKGQNTKPILCGKRHTEAHANLVWK